MKLPSTITDNVTELLCKIVEFTERRRQVLSENVKNAGVDGYIPKDLDVDGFAEVMTGAVVEHMRSQRLVLCDQENIRFGGNGFFESVAVVDSRASQLLECNPKGYLEYEVNKLAENLVNNKMARRLLERKQSREAGTEA